MLYRVVENPLFRVQGVTIRYRLFFENHSNG